MPADVRVTVLIPVFNGAAFVGTAIDSALDQRAVQVEVIVIDDGSTDDTPDVLASYGDRISVVRQQNRGHVVARNRGARSARGEWLAFLDADDEWLPDKLARQIALAGDAQDVAMVYTDRENVGEITRVGSRASDAYTLQEGDIFEPLLLTGNFVTVSSAMVRRSWYDRLGGFDETLGVCEDWDMWLRLCAAGGRVAVVQAALTKYRWHAVSMTMNHQRMAEGRLIVLRRALASDRGRHLPRSIVHKAFASTLRTSAWYALHSQPGNALRWYLGSIRHDPVAAAAYRGCAEACARLLLKGRRSQFQRASG